MRGLAAGCLVGSLAVFVFSAVASGHPLEPVPPGHWAYRALYHLAAAGLIPTQRLSSQPLTRGAVRALTLEARERADTMAVSPGTRDLLDALVAGFAGGERPASRTLRLRLGDRRGSSASAGWSTGTETWVIGVEGSVFEGSAAVSRAYGRYERGRLALQAGRDVLWWGSSPRSTLFLSDEAGSLDSLWLAVGWRSVALTKFVAPLSLEVGRYLIGSRLDWQASPGLRIGFTELVVARPSGMMAFWMLNPLPVVLSDLLDPIRVRRWFGIPDVENPLGGVDFDWRLRPGVVLSGQVLVDDLSATFPPRAGAQLGLFFADPFHTGRTSLRLEYTAVANWTYTDMSGYDNHFLWNGRPLGFWLGNDSDDLFLELSHVLDAGRSVGGWLAQTRRGEGRIGTQWTTADAAWVRWWLSGVVETRRAAGIYYEWRWFDGWARLLTEVGTIDNQGHAAGVQGWDTRLGVHWSHSW